MKVNNSTYLMVCFVLVMSFVSMLGALAIGSCARKSDHSLPASSHGGKYPHHHDVDHVIDDLRTEIRRLVLEIEALHARFGNTYETEL